jgi:mono/diheme cytochrome c family protein
MQYPSVGSANGEICDEAYASRKWRSYDLTISPSSRDRKEAMNARMRLSLLLICSLAAGAFVVPLIVLSAALLGWLPTDAVSDPAMWESRLGQAVLKVSLAHKAARFSNPIESSDAELLTGMQAFKDNCSGCHGDARKVSHWGNSNFYPRVPQFARNPPALTAPEMFVAIKYGIRYSGMFANERMKEKKIWQIATFLSHLNSLPPEIDRAWRETP